MPRFTKCVWNIYIIIEASWNANLFQLLLVLFQFIFTITTEERNRHFNWINLIFIILWSRNSKSQPLYRSISMPDLPKQAHDLGRPLHWSIWHQRRRYHARRWQDRFQWRNVWKYLQAWINDLDWISRRDRGLSHVFCRVCNSQISVAMAGWFKCCVSFVDTQQGSQRIWWSS